MGKRQKPGEHHIQAVWRDVVDLSDREQLQVYDWLRSYLLRGPGDPLPPDSQIEGRREALECMQRAAEHHRLRVGKAPTVEQYQEAHEALALPLSSQQVIRRWGYWRTAKLAFEGGRVPMTVKQQEHARATQGRHRNHEEYIEGLRIWLATDPLSITYKDYEAFADSYNINLATGIPPLVKVSAIQRALALTWNDALSVAHGQLDLAEAQEQARRRRERDRGVHNLVGTRDLVQMLDHSGQRLTAGTREPGLPVSVATIGLYRAWYATDIEAYRDGEPVPERVEGELQDKLLLSRDIARITGLKHEGLPHALRKKDWHRLPPSAGKVSGTYYWDKAAVEQWKRSVKPRPTGRKTRKNSVND